MGLLADIYLANDDTHAKQYDSAPDIFADRLQYRSFTQLELSILWAIMQGTTWDPKSLRQFTDVFHANGGERLICRLPDPMLDHLTKLSEDQISAAAAKWAVTDQLRCKPSDVRPIIEGLITSARTALQSGRKVYLWNCV